MFVPLLAFGLWLLGSPWVHAHGEFQKIAWFAYVIVWTILIALALTSAYNAKPKAA